MFTTNVGTIDRIVRILIGAALVLGFFLNTESSWRVLYLIGLVPLATGIFQTCPAYRLFGISTCATGKR